MKVAVQQVPDCLRYPPGPEVVFGAAGGMIMIYVPVQYHLFELVGVPKAFGIAVDEVIHCMEQVEI